MKKVLALVLTAAMLLSCVAMSVSAVREFSTNTVVTTDMAATNTANFCGLRYNDPYFTDDYTFKIVMKSCSADFGDMAENTGFCDGVPIINMKANTIGWNNGPSLSYTFADDTWYTIEYVVDGNTTIIVNGETVGTLDGAMPGNIYGSFYNSYVTEISYIGADGTVALYEDFEDGTDDVFSTEVTTFEESTVEIVANDNVAYGTLAAATNTANFCGLRYNDPYATDDYTATFVMKSCSADFGDMAENTGFCDGVPIINMKANTIGWNNGPSLSYTFADDTWYTIEYVVDGNTTIKVNGETVGTLDGAMPGNLYGSFYNSYVADVKYVGADGSVYLDADFSDGEDEIFSTEITYFSVVNNKYDLGMYYWQLPEGNSYNPVSVTGVDGEHVIEMDICLDDAASKLGNWDGLAQAATITTTSVGAGAESLAYNFTVGTWYHVKWEVGDGETAIYVDDTYVGTVADVPTYYDGSQAFWVWDKISIDNLSIGDFYNDMETTGMPESGYQGLTMVYDFGIVEEDPLKDVPKYTAEGNALLLENSANNAYLEIKAEGVDYSTGILSFDVALIPNDQDPGSEGTYIEFWRDVAYKRFKVGTEWAGRDDDTYLYSAVEGMEEGWGEATWNNFHNVTIWFENNKGTIYVDGVQMYSGLCGDPNEGNFLMMLWNGSAIIDNFYYYDLDMNVLFNDLAGNFSDNSAIDCVAVNIDTEDFCTDNCHVYGAYERTIAPTCTAVGEDTIWCAICGGAKTVTEVPMIPHKYNNFDNTRIADDQYYTDCKACGKRLYSAVPAADSYTGTIYGYFDMSDAMFGELKNGDVDVLDSGWFGDQFRYEEDGKAVLDADSYLANYSSFSFEDVLQQKVPSADWSYNFKLTYNGMWDTDDNINSGYPHTMYFWLRGVTLELGYDADLGVLYIGPSQNPGAVAIERVEAEYEFKEGLTYDFKFGLWFCHDEESEWFEYAEIAIWINGEKVLVHSLDDTGADIYYDCEFDSDVVDAIYCRNFGYAYTMDDLTIASFDFEWNKVVGDVDNDGVLSAADAMMMRKYLAKVIGDADVHVDLMDVNGDGVINAKDQLTIRKALAA